MTDDNTPDSLFESADLEPQEPKNSGEPTPETSEEKEVAEAPESTEENTEIDAESEDEAEELKPTPFVPTGPSIDIVTDMENSYIA